MKAWAGIAALIYMVTTASAACTAPASVCFQETQGSFPLVRDGHPAAILVDDDADPGVRHVADAFAADLQRVSGRAALRVRTADEASGAVVVVGVLGHSAIIDGLVRAGKIATSDIAGQWETYRQIVVEHPLPNVARGLAIVGADRRGAVYGAYDVSERSGVSPWYWFADVPIRQHANVFVTAGSRRDQPKVRYRGFFINDEEPAFGRWARQHFVGMNC